MVSDIFSFLPFFLLLPKILSFFIVRNAKEEEKKNSVKTNVFTDFPLSDFALRAFCRLQKQKTSMTLRIFLSRGRRVFFSFFSLLASQFLFSQRSPLSFSLFLFAAGAR